MEKSRQAIVTLAIGDRYLRIFNETFRPSLERYARNIATPLCVVTEAIQPSPKHPSWQKLLLFRHPALSGYDRILMVDADIYITRHAKDIFAALGDLPWGAAKNNAYDLASLALTDQNLYEHCPPQNRPAFVVNCGMFVMTRQYQARLENIFNSNAEQTCYEQGPLSYFLLNEGKGKVLPSEFNTIVVSYIDAHGRGLSSILEMYLSSSFIHFTAGKHKAVFHFVRWFDQTDSKLLRKAVPFLAHKRFDPLTALIFRFAEWCIGSYNFRIKRFFSR